MSYDAPFAGLKVVDLSQGIAGPYCAMLLAQHGAQVIKVESLGEGDWARALGVRYGSHTAFSIIVPPSRWHAINRIDCSAVAACIRLASR